MLKAEAALNKAHFAAEQLGDAKAYQVKQEVIEQLYDASGFSRMNGDAAHDSFRAARLELLRCQHAGDAKGEATVLVGIAASHLANGDFENTTTAAEQALARLIVVDDCYLEALVNLALAYSCCAMRQFEKANVSTQRAVDVLSRLGDKDGKALAQQLIIIVYEAWGQEPPESALRSEARQVLQKVAEAVQARDSLAYASAMEVLVLQHGLVRMDVLHALRPLYEEDLEGTSEFLKVCNTEGTPNVDKVPQLAQTTYGDEFYLPVRIGALGYGPRFRQVFPFKFPELTDVTASEVFGLLIQSSQADEWQHTGFDPATIDAMAHTAYLYGFPRRGAVVSIDPNEKPSENKGIPIFLDKATLCPEKRALNHYVYGRGGYDMMCMPATS